VTDIDLDVLADKVAERVAERIDVRPLLKISDAAAWLGVSRRTFYDFIDRGEIRTVKVGGQMRVEPAELDRYVQERR
jgi:excisionase family DNA binding protein